MSVLADAGKNIEDLPAVGTGVLHAIRRHEWQLEFRSEIDQRFIDALFVAQEMALDLDVDIVATEEVDKKLDSICPTLGSARALVRQLPERLAERNGSRRRVSGEGARNSTRGACAPQKRDKSLSVLPQLIPLHRAFVFYFAPQVRLC